MAAILNFIVDHPGQAFTLTDLVKALKLSRATCHALLTGLVEVGYLYRASDKNYILGPALASIGRVALKHASPLQVAQPEMRALADEFDAFCAAYFREGDEIVLRDRAASVSHVGSSIPAGARLKLAPHFAALYGAFAQGPEATSWLTTCTPPLTDAQREEMVAGMAFLRKHGYAAHIRNPAASWDYKPEQVFRESSLIFPTSLLPEIEDDKQYQLVGIIAPVFGEYDQIAMLLGLSGLPQPLKGKDIQKIAERLTSACSRISAFITGSSRPTATAA